MPHRRRRPGRDAAAHRKTWHRRHINSATTWRRQIYSAAGWLIAETAQLPVSERAAVARELTAIAARLNDRNGADHG